MKRLLILVFAASLVSVGDAQNRMAFSPVTADSGHVALGLAIRRSTCPARSCKSAAHPDDEHNALFALFTLRQGLRSADVQTNRGEGGQNEIGPELFRDIGVLRTSELLVRPPRGRRRAVLHPRDRLRLLVLAAGSDRQVGTERDGRRFRPPDPHAASRGPADDEHPGRRRRSRARSDDRARDRGVSRGRRSVAVSGTDQGRAPPLAAEEAVLLRVRRRRRRRTRAAAVRLAPRPGSRASTPACTTSCSAARTPTSAPTRAAITSARAPAAVCPRFPASPAGAAGSAASRSAIS